MLLTLHEAWQINRRTALAEREEEGLAIRWMDGESHLLHWQLIFFLVDSFHKGEDCSREKPLQNIVLNFLFCIAVLSLQKTEKGRKKLYQEESLQTAVS